MHVDKLVSVKYTVETEPISCSHDDMTTKQDLKGCIEGGGELHGRVPR